jgi:hypothetical protein
MSHRPLKSAPKKWFGVRRWLFLTLLACGIIGLVVYVLYAGSQLVTMGVIPHERELRALTIKLPDVERIEVELVHVHFDTIDKVLDSKILTGDQVKELENLWRSQSYTFDGHVLCHEPIYRIRFFKDNALLTEATVCFQCHNIYFYKHAGPEGSEEPLDATFSLNGADSPYKQLRSYLSSLFPGHDVEAESRQKPN